MGAALSEKTIENQILNWLAWKGIYVWKTKTTGTYDSKRGRYLKPSPLYRTGVSDIIGLAPNGKLIAIEVKSAKGKLQENQKTFIAEIIQRGGIAFVARSIQDVEDVLLLYGFI